MGNTCDNNLTIEGSEEALEALTKWINSQTHDKAPNARWAALYNLEIEADCTDGIGVVGSGSANHAYGDADYSVGEKVAQFQWASKNNPSIDAVMTLAKKFPELSFEFSYDEPGHGLKGSLSCEGGTVQGFGGGYEDDSEGWDWDSEDESEGPPI